MNTGADSPLREFAASQSETAFEAVVRQHLNLVFATACRQLGNHALAEEVCQNVFIQLAKKADSLSSHPTVAGWLHKATLLECRRMLRTELRRQRREAVALALGTLNAEGDSIWSALLPLLDEVLLQLSEQDRLAVLLRFFEGKPLREVGQALGASEDAAQKRVNRALNQMTENFRRRGFAIPVLTASTPLLAAALAQAAPAGLVQSVVVAGRNTAAGAGTLSWGFKLFQLMSMTKIKATLLIGAGLLLTATGLLNVANSRFKGEHRPAIVLEKSTQTASPVAAKPSAFWRRVKAIHHGQASATGADEDLREKLAQLQTLLYAPPTVGGSRNDAAYNLIQGIPLEKRGAALALVSQALRDGQQHVCQRALWILPLIWPEGEAALPDLWDVVRKKSTLWPALASEAMIAALQVRADPDIVPELVTAAMSGTTASREALSRQLPLLVSLLRGESAPFVTSLQPYLYSPDESVRLAAAQALGQLPGSKDPAVLAELTAALGKASGTGHELDNARSVVGVLWKLGPAATEAIPALLKLAELNPELREITAMAVKAIAPESLKGVGIPTPLPPGDATSQTMAQRLEAGTWSLQNAIAALRSPETLLPTARALAEFGPGAAAALPELRRALDSVASTDLSTALVLGSAIERLAPDSPKPFLLIMDVLPALEAVYQEAKKADHKGWDEALQGLSQRVPIDQVIRHEDVRSLASELSRIDPRLATVFKSTLLETDAKFGALFKP